MRLASLFFIVAATLMASMVRAEEVSLPVGFDRWVYPFSATPGIRATGSVFGSILEPGFDDRDAQLVLGFDVVALQESSQPIESLTVLLTMADVEGVIYDPTSDALATYLDESTDTDAGRPVELYGVAVRNGLEGLALTTRSGNYFYETSSFSNRPGQFENARSVFVSDYANGEARDISNNVRQSFEAHPWAVGQLDDVVAGTVVSANSTFEFELDLSQANVRNYVNAAIDTGALFLGISSLHSAAQDGPVVYPSFYLDAGGVSLGATATLEIVLGNALPGDFDADGLLTANDIDQLFGVMRSGSYSALHDVNDDQAVDALDRDTWIQDLRRTWAGDANLDGTFDSADLVQVFQASQFEDLIIANSTWETGDWTGDGEFDSSDLVFAFQMGGYQDAAAVRAVPEPNAFSCVGIVLVLLYCRHSVLRSCCN